MPHRIRLGVIAMAAGAALAVAVSYGGMSLRWFRAPYPAFGKSVAWTLGTPEPAYNFDVVRPGALFRSGAPDARLVRYVHERYGVQRIVSLAGPFEGHDAARELGIAVDVFHWAGDRLPLRRELEHVLGIIDDGVPVLVHCKHGAVRAGLTMATYRVTRERWSPERAVDELFHYGPQKSFSPRLHREIHALLGGADGPKLPSLSDA